MAGKDKRLDLVTQLEYNALCGYHVSVLLWW